MSIDHGQDAAQGIITTAIVGEGSFSNKLLLHYILENIGPCRLIPLTSWLECIHHPDVFFVDCSRMSPYALDELLLKKQDKTAEQLTVLYNLSDNVEIEKNALVTGVSGLFYESDDPEHLKKCCELIIRGEIWISRSRAIKSIIKDRRKQHGAYRSTVFPFSSLTEREQEVLALLASGNSNRDIAKLLFISPHTARTHVYNIFRKLQVKNRLQVCRLLSNPQSEATLSLRLYS